MTVYIMHPTITACNILWQHQFHYPCSTKYWAWHLRYGRIWV